MIRDDYQYALEIRRADQTTLGPYRLTVDWVPAWEWLTLRAWDSTPESAARSLSGAKIEPRWDSTHGEPYVDGVRVSSLGGVEGPCSGELTADYFRPSVKVASRLLLEQKRLQAGETFTSRIVAFPARRESTIRSGLRLEIDEVHVPVSISRSRLADFRHWAKPLGENADGDLPVFVPQPVLREAAALTRAAESNESGGMLLGRVHHDVEGGGLFLVVTALIIARHAVSGSTRFTFTADTWAAATAALELRRSRELMVGWFHSHPARYWCQVECTAEARRRCPLNESFFSPEDCALHRTVFPKAFSIALLITNTFAGLRYALFGWRRGLLEQRGFHVLNPTDAWDGEMAGQALVGDQHEKNCG